MKEADREIAALAERQFGAISRRQAAKAGLSDEAMTRRVMTERWDRLLPGVYRLAGVPPTLHQRAIAAVLWAGEMSASSHTSGAWLLQLVPERSGPLHITLPPGTAKYNDAVVVHRSALPPLDVVEVDGIRCTSATRTIIDCAALLDDEALEGAFEAARRMGLTSPAALGRRAAELCGPGRPGSVRVRRLIAAQLPGERALEPRLEVRLARLLRASALPPATRQHRVGRFRLDFAWPESLVGCECDGFEHHGARLAWKRDRARLAAIEAMGWRIVHVTWDDVTRQPAQTIERLAFSLRKAA